MFKDAIIRVSYNRGGHPREFTINLPGFNHDNYIPRVVDRRIQDALGRRYTVSNRGSRLEVNSQLFTGDGDEHLPTVVGALLGSLEGIYETVPAVETDLVPYTPPAPVTRACPRGCGQSFEFRDLIGHVRAEHA